MSSTHHSKPSLFSAWTSVVAVVLMSLGLFNSGCSVSDASADAAAEPNVSQSNRDRAEVVWRFAIEEAVGSVQYEYARRFQEKISAASQGRIDVEIYPYGTLGTSTQITEQLNMGILEFAMASPGSLGKFIPELQIFLLHFLLSEDEEVNRRVLRSPELLARFDELYAEKGLQLLAFYPEGEMVWTTKREIRTPRDFRGVKFRVMTSPILLSAYSAYGASPTPMPYSEVYSGLQLNMIDAQVNPVFAIERQKFFEVTDWLIFPRHAHFITSAAANRDFIAGLSSQDRAMVLGAIDELDDEIFRVQRSFQTSRLKDILQAAKDKGHELHLCGDLSGFVASLSAEERESLIDDNPYLFLEPAWSDEERAEFARRSRDVEDVFLRIGGDDAEDVLQFFRDLVAEQESRATSSAALPAASP